MPSYNPKHSPTKNKLLYALKVWMSNRHEVTRMFIVYILFFYWIFLFLGFGVTVVFPVLTWLGTTHVAVQVLLGVPGVLGMVGLLAAGSVLVLAPSEWDDSWKRIDKYNKKYPDLKQKHT